MLTLLHCLTQWWQFTESFQKKKSLSSLFGTKCLRLIVSLNFPKNFFRTDVTENLFAKRIKARICLKYSFNWSKAFSCIWKLFLVAMSFNLIKSWIVSRSEWTFVDKTMRKIEFLCCGKKIVKLAAWLEFQGPGLNKCLARKFREEFQPALKTMLTLVITRFFWFFGWVWDSSDKHVRNDCG